MNNFNADNYTDYIPEPIFDKNPEYVNFYYRAWEIVKKHVKEIDGMPQTPYMDEGFCDTQIWIWDSCFMSLYCKYAQNVFPGKETFKNFYYPIHEKVDLPNVIPSESEPSWTGATPGVPFRIQIDIADNPPLFAWAEYENALIHGDKIYIRDLLYDKKYLQKHYEWLENLKSETMLNNVAVNTCWIKEKYGYKWEGGRSGMDNTPRGRTGVKADKERPNNPDMLWIDAICQQALSAKCISNLFGIIGDKTNAKIWAKKYKEQRKIINRFYWDKKDKFYYDIDCNSLDFYKVLTLASYWTMLSGVANKKKAEYLVKKVLDDRYFGGKFPLVSLSRSDADFDEKGRYWRGSIWLPTAYATIKGLVNYGYYEVAEDCSKKILDHMIKTYAEFEPHTIWECYSPTEYKPGTQTQGENGARPDFCGWSALGPISLLIENVLGFYSINAFNKTVKWNIPKVEGKVGIRNLHFGNIETDMEFENGELFVKSNEKYILFADGKKLNINAGENIFIMKKER